MIKSARSIAYLSLSLTSLIWSIGAILIKYSLAYTDPVSFLFWRFFIVSWILLPLLVWRFKKASYTLAQLGHLALLGFLSTTVTLGLLFWGMSLTTATEAIIINNIGPVFIIIGGWLILKEKLERLEIIGSAAAVFGSLVMIVQPLMSVRFSMTNFLGNLLIVISAAVWAAYSLAVRRDEQKQKYDPFILTAIAFLVGFITITPLYLAQHPNDWFIPSQAFTGIIWMAIPGSVIAYFTYNLGLSLIEASEATIFTYLQAVFAIPMAIIFLNEKLSPSMIAGATIILIGVFLTEFRLTSKKINRICLLLPKVFGYRHRGCQELN